MNQTDLGGIAQLITALISLATFVQSRRIASRVEIVHKATNSMKDALVQSTRAQSLLEGAATERAEQVARSAAKAEGVQEERDRSGAG